MLPRVSRQSFLLAVPFRWKVRVAKRKMNMRSVTVDWKLMKRKEATRITTVVSSSKNWNSRLPLNFICLSPSSPLTVQTLSLHLNPKETVLKLSIDFNALAKFRLPKWKVYVLIGLKFWTINFRRFLTMSNGKRYCLELFGPKLTHFCPF